MGMTEEDKQAVIAARQSDWNCNGNDGYEPPGAKAILDKYKKSVEAGNIR